MKNQNISEEYLHEVRRIIGSWLRVMRENKKLTQQELADKMGVQESTVSKIETGRWSVSLDMLVLFSVHLDFYPFFVEKDSKDELAESMRNRWKRSHEEN